MLDVARYVEMLYQSINQSINQSIYSFIALQDNSKCAIVAAKQDEQGYRGALTAAYINKLKLNNLKTGTGTHSTLKP